MSIENELQELKRLARAYIEAEDDEVKTSASLENAERNFDSQDQERSAYGKAILKAYSAREELKKAIGAKP